MSSLLVFNYTLYRRRYSQSCWYLGKEWHMKALKGGYKVKHTVNVDCVKFEYLVLAKYHHMLIFEFDLLTKQHILILCKKLL